MQYQASWDKPVKVITIGVTILFIAILSIPFFEKEDDPVRSFFLSAVIVLIYLGVYLFRPVSYMVTGEVLIIHRPLKDLNMDLRQIESVLILEKGALKFSIRTFGVGGLFGNFGKFYNSQFGKMTWYATRMDRAVLITTVDGKKIVVTPDDSEGFVNQFERDHSLIP